MLLAEPIAVAPQLGEVLDELGISWLVGGSVASSLHGIPRATQDIGLVADLQQAQIQSLVSALESDFHIDADTNRDALRRRRAFNVIHLATMTKVDVFPLEHDRLSEVRWTVSNVTPSMRRAGRRCRWPAPRTSSSRGWPGIARAVAPSASGETSSACSRSEAQARTGTTWRHRRKRQGSVSCSKKRLRQPVKREAQSSARSAPGGDSQARFERWLGRPVPRRTVSGRDPGARELVE